MCQKFFFQKISSSELVFDPLLWQFALHLKFRAGVSKGFGWKWAFFAETRGPKTCFFNRGYVQMLSKFKNSHAPTNPFVYADPPKVRLVKKKLQLWRYPKNYEPRVIRTSNDKQVPAWRPWRNVRLFSKHSGIKPFQSIAKSIPIFGLESVHVPL